MQVTFVEWVNKFNLTDKTNPKSPILDVVNDFGVDNIGGFTVDIVYSSGIDKTEKVQTKKMESRTWADLKKELALYDLSNAVLYTIELSPRDDPETYDLIPTFSIRFGGEITRLA